jgi:hypothetical protein
METHLNILKQVLLYYCKKNNWGKTIDDIESENDYGKNVIRLFIYNDLK